MLKKSSHPSRTAMERLLAFYTDPELSISLGTEVKSFIPGNIVCGELAKIMGADAPTKCTEIKASHIQKYLSTKSATDNDPAIIEREADLMAITVLLTKSDLHGSSAVSNLIMKLQDTKGTTYTAYPDEATLIDGLDIPTISNEEIKALYNSALNKLQASGNDLTRSAVSYVKFGIKTQSTSMALENIMMAPINAARNALMDEERRQLSKRVADNPGIDLTELDFNGFESAHKTILRESLNALKQSTPNSVEANPKVIQFNQVVRGIFAKYPSTITEDVHKKEIDAKLKYTLGKLAIVLRQNHVPEAAEKIMAHLHPLKTGKHLIETVSKREPSHNPTDKNFAAEKQSLVKSVIDRLEKLVNPAANGKTFKFAEFFGGRDKPTTAEKEKQPALPADIQQIITEGSLDDAQMRDFIVKLRKNADVATTAERKLVHRMQKLQAALQDIALEKELQAELDANNAKFDSKDTIMQINPSTEMFERFKKGYKKLSERVKTPTNEVDKKKAFLNDEQLAQERVKALDAINTDMVRTQRRIETEQEILTAQTGKDVPASLEKVKAQNRLDDINNLHTKATEILSELLKTEKSWTSWLTGGFLGMDQEDISKTLIKARELKQEFDKQAEKILNTEPAKFDQHNQQQGGQSDQNEAMRRKLDQLQQAQQQQPGANPVNQEQQVVNEEPEERQQAARLQS